MKKYLVVFPVFILIPAISFSQMITGVWKGKIDKRKVELKIILNGDSLTGTSYYYESANNYRRYSIKGYFDPNTNSAVWWDDRLIEERTGKSIFGAPGKIPYLSTADFNCPGENRMLLEGNAALKEKPEIPKGPVDLVKTNSSIFTDEWDFVIDNYLAGANHPDIIDSVGAITSAPVAVNDIVVAETKPQRETVFAPPMEKPVVKQEPIIEQPVKVQEEKKIIPSPLPTIEEKFSSRKRIISTEIPLSGDSIELRFYDNAEIDGDSISLFLNDKLIFQHIRLTASAYIVKLPVAELKEINELVMVAENLGEIPPNTSYMIAYVDGKRYAANLASTEQSSATIRLVKNLDAAAKDQ